MCPSVDHLVHWFLATTQVAPDHGVRGARDDVRHHTLCWLLTVEAPLQFLMCTNHGGAAGIRTPDLRLAKAALSRLSYGPMLRSHALAHHRWARPDSNQGPRPYQGRAPTRRATPPPRHTG